VIESEARKKLAGFFMFCLGASPIVGTGEALAAMLEEIVVTAQKREQNIQDVPIAITALSGDEIRALGFENAADVQYQVPGLIVSYSSTNAIPNFVLRGVGLNDFTAIQSSPVAIHVDEVFYGNSTLLNFSLFDIGRVEVLKGPQGTLFGRNTTGGAVNFFSARPLNEFEANLDLSYARYDTFSAEGYITGPLGDTLSGRLSVSTTNRSGGYFDHPVHGKVGERDTYALRGQLLWDVSERLSAHLTVFGGKDDSEGNQYQGIPTYTNDGNYGVCTPIQNGNLGVSSPACSFDSGDALIDDDNPFTLQSGVVNRDEIDAFGTVFTLNYELGNGLIFTSITGYNRADRESQEDADGSPERNIDVGYETEFKQFSEELRLFSEGDGPWTWTAGLFYSTDELDTPLTETDGFDLAYNQNHTYELETDSFAVFLHNEFRVSDPFTVIAGLRYTEEERSFVGGTYSVTPGGGPSASGDFVVNAGTTSEDAFLDRDIDFDEISWTLGVNFDVSDQAMVYAKIANGFKSGGFIGDITVQSILEEPYDEETLTSYEIGLKSDWLDGALRWNAAVFYYDYQDVILALTVPRSELPVDPGFDPLINENGADADVWGFESDIWLAPVEGLDIKFGFAWLDTEMSGLETSPYDVQERLDGNELVYALEFSANGLIRYEAPVAGEWLGYGQFGFTARSEHWAESTNAPGSGIEGYTLLDARLGMRSSERRWSVSAWIKNIADERYTQYLNDLQGLGSILITPGYPRTYGLDVSLSF